MAATHPIRLGIQTAQQGIAWSQMLDLWQKADAWGYDSLWNFDHFYPIFVDPEGPCFVVRTCPSDGHVGFYALVR